MQILHIAGPVENHAFTDTLYDALIGTD